jgi:hypothetical protein
MSSSLIRTREEITTAWLAGALDRPGIEVESVSRIGTGQMSECHRVAYSTPGGEVETVVVKISSADDASRAAGVGMGAYVTEVAFYRNLAARLGGAVPKCLLAEHDPAAGWFTLVLEDIAGAAQGDQIAGCSVEDAKLAITALARVHAPVLGDIALSKADWLNQPKVLNQDLMTALLPGFLERYGDRIAPEHAAVCERFAPSLDAWAADRRAPQGLVHRDYRLDNLLFGDGTCRIVDWQCVGWGEAMLDAAYFIGGGLSTADRREHEESLVRTYHGELLAQGVTGFGWEECWEGYRRQSFFGILMTVIASMVVERTDRGDEMFMTWLERNAQQILDLDAISLLPEPRSAPPAPLRPQPSDEGRHPVGVEPLWNESWYFDAVSDDGQLGVYVRIGRVPNQDACFYAACVCGPDRPSIMIADEHAPLPAEQDDIQAIHTDRLQAEHLCLEPLESFRVVLTGAAQSHEDPSAPLRAEAGQPAEISLDLTWQTDGIPFQWRQTTRYEIPCRVTGTVRVDREEIAFAGPGQRDHSWGARDWWASDWMWSALHLDDGSRTHAVGVPQMPGFGVGYVQRAGVISEITSVNATHDVAENGLVTGARIISGPEELAVDVEPIAYGALRLQAPDGRLSFFPRAMCRVHTDDGRSGVGWVEWNRVQRDTA